MGKAGLNVGYGSLEEMIRAAERDWFLNRESLEMAGVWSRGWRERGTSDCCGRIALIRFRGYTLKQQSTRYAMWRGF